MIDITQPNMILMKDGVEISRHRSEVEAMESASENGPGAYTLVRPDATIVVEGAAPVVPIDPEPVEPDPGPVEPPTEPDPVDPPVGADGVIFETDFSEDAGFVSQPSAGWSSEGVPAGFLATKGGSQHLFAVEGAGYKGSNAVRFNYPGKSDQAGTSQPTLSLLLHLTNDARVGYDDVYVRYRVKLPDRFKAGTGAFAEGLPYWKWARLWQNTDPDDRASWTENREDSGYVVWNFAGSQRWGFDINAAASANDGDGLSSGSSGGPRATIDWYAGSSPSYASYEGMFENMPGWEIDRDQWPGHLKTLSEGIEQEYHTVEFRVKLATTPDANDGVLEFWFDGVHQGSFKRIKLDGGASGIDGIPTANRGSGFNSLTVFDNMAEWNEDWEEDDVEGGIYLSDLVVSTQRIGHDYVAGNNKPY